MFVTAVGFALAAWLSSALAGAHEASASSPPLSTNAVAEVRRFAKRKAKPICRVNAGAAFACTLLALLSKPLIISGAGEGSPTLVIIAKSIS
jgi:hypothetical protein